MKRLVEFLRSVLPADPAQLFFLAGTICIVIAPRLSWWPVGFEIASEHRADWVNRLIRAFPVVIFFPVLFAGIAGYFIAFWPGPRPVRRILSCIYLPTVPVLTILCLRLIVLVSPHRSVLEAVEPHTRGWSEFPLLRVPGLQFCLIGLLLIGDFTARLLDGRSSLPLALPVASVLHHDDPATRWRMQVLIWVLIGPLFLTMAFLIIPLLLSSRLTPYVFSVWFVHLANLAYALVMLGVALCIIGKSAVHLLRRAFRSPGEKHALLAVAFSAGIPALIALGQYLWGHAQFVRHDVGSFEWQSGTFFNFPDGWLFLLFFPALAEEIIFRGWLQPRFVRSYGLYRGIFLVGISWAAFHIPYDLSFSHFGFWPAIQTVCFRLFTCIALSFVLGWLTLETGSVLAAALAHTFYNVLIYSDLGPPFPGKDLLRIGLWAVLGWILFRYWPMRPELPEAQRVAKVSG
jgi:membrane protease YdiL (CAAX protease family)